MNPAPGRPSSKKKKPRAVTLLLKAFFSILVTLIFIEAILQVVGLFYTFDLEEEVSPEGGIPILHSTTPTGCMPF